MYQWVVMLKSTMQCVNWPNSHGLIRHISNALLNTHHGVRDKKKRMEDALFPREATVKLLSSVRPCSPQIKVMD